MFRKSSTFSNSAGQLLHSMQKIPSLDGLRAVSILIVFLFHAALNDGRVLLGRHSVDIPGPLGVTVFFFLSGYLITTLLRREFEKTGSVSFKAFYARRLLRIFPPLYFVIALAWVLGKTGVVVELTGAQMLAALLQVGNYFMLYGPSPGLPPSLNVLWSLAVEEHFYLVFPLIYVALLKAKLRPLQQASVFWALCGGFLMWRLVLILVLGASRGRVLLGTDTRFDSMLFGCALAVWGNPALDTTRIPQRVWTWVLLPLGVVGLLGSHLIPATVRDAFKYTVEGVALVPVFCAAVRYPTWGPLKILNTRPLVVLGVISYSLYLIHNVVLILLERVTARAQLPFFVFGLAGSVVLAWLMHKLIELPCNRLRHRLFSESRQPLPAPQLDVGAPRV